MLEPVLAEPLRLEAIVAVRQARIGLAHGGDERLDDLGLDPVREVARIGDVLEAAPAVRDLLVLRQRVGDEREGAQVRLEHLGERLGGVPAERSVGVLQLVEGRLERQFLAAHLEAQRRDGLVEKAVPGGAPGDRLFVEQLLDLVLELERLVLADVLEPGPVAGKRLRLHRGVEHRIVDAVELEGEEQELARGRGQALLRVAVELGPLRIGGVAGIDEAGIGHDPAEEILDRLVAQDGGAERMRGVLASGEPVERAAVGLGEGLALGLGPGEVAARNPGCPWPGRGRRDPIRARPRARRAWSRSASAGSGARKSGSRLGGIRMEVPARAGRDIGGNARSINPREFDRTGPRHAPSLSAALPLSRSIAPKRNTGSRVRATCQAPFSSSTTIRFSGGFWRRWCAASATSRSWPRPARRGCRSCARRTGRASTSSSSTS